MEEIEPLFRTCKQSESVQSHAKTTPQCKCKNSERYRRRNRKRVADAWCKRPLTVTRFLDYFCRAIMKYCRIVEISGNKICLTLSLKNNFPALHQSKNFSIVFTLSFALNFFSKSGISSSASSDLLAAAIFERQVVQNNIATGFEDFPQLLSYFAHLPGNDAFFSKQVEVYLVVLYYH